MIMMYRFVAKLNHHPAADIHVESVQVYDFADDYMSILNDEEHEAKYSLDEMKLMDEEEKLIVKDPPVKQHVEAFIDEQEDKTIVLQENVKHESNKSQYFNVVKDDYKPCLANVFSNVKPKRKKCGVERNYVLRSVKERKKRLAMSLDSSYGQQATTTPALPKIISQSVNGDFIMAPEFKEAQSYAYPNEVVFKIYKNDYVGFDPIRAIIYGTTKMVKVEDIGLIQEKVDGETKRVLEEDQMCLV
nr:hypothetical protein [Tanacetum cinerariifolium]